MTQSLKHKLHKFDLSNVEDLKKAGKYLIPELDTVLEKFYERALKDPEAKSYFDSNERVNFARSAQKKHWELLLAGEFGADYAASVERIGRTHARIKLPLDVYSSSYACAASHLISLLMKKTSGGFLGFGSRDASKMVCALTRALALDIEGVTDITFTVWGEEQTIALGHLETAIMALAEGDVAHVIPGPQTSDYPASYDGLRVKFNEATHSLSSMVAKMASVLGSLLETSSKVQKSTDDLAERTVSQAASLEESSAALEQLTHNIAEASDKTDATSKVGQTARHEVDEGAAIIGDAAEAMKSIQGATENINQISAFIEDIAFQTNLLSLNASVEAARAGDAGRGFAVVASEVRSLAARTADSAKEIKGLIASSGQSVNEGAALIEKANQAFEKIVLSFDEVASLTSEVATASKEQSSGLGEVNIAVRDMDRMTQLNAGMVDQTLLAMQSMTRETSELQRLVSTMTYEEHSAVRPQASSGAAA